MMEMSASPTVEPARPALPEPRVAELAPAERVERAENAQRTISEALEQLGVEFHSLRFELNGHDLVIEVLDEEGDVVRTIPPAELRELAARYGIQSGLLVDVFS